MVISGFDFFVFFFFKQKTAYEMRISDWSSDVCSSDLNRILNNLLENQAGSSKRMTETPKSHLPLRIEEITADWLSTVLAENYPGTKVTEVHVGTVIAGTATKVRLLLAYNEAGHAHRLPPTMWLKGGFIRHAYPFDASFVNEAKFFDTWTPEMNIHIRTAYWQGCHEGM